MIKKEKKTTAGKAKGDNSIKMDGGAREQGGGGGTKDKEEGGDGAGGGEGEGTVGGAEGGGERRRGGRTGEKGEKRKRWRRSKNKNERRWQDTSEPPTAREHNSLSVPRQTRDLSKWPRFALKSYEVLQERPLTIWSSGSLGLK